MNQSDTTANLREELQNAPLDAQLDAPLNALQNAALNSPQDLRELFWVFSTMAMQGFGGVVTVIQRTLVTQKRWLTDAQFVEEWAMAQVLPGPNALNLCANLGGRYFGARGAVVAILGLLAFPMLLVLCLAVVYTSTAHIAWVAGALRGMGAVAAGLVIATGLRLATSLRAHVLHPALVWGLAGASFVGVALLRWRLSYVLLGVGLLACVLTWLALKAQTNKSKSQGAD